MLTLKRTIVLNVIVVTTLLFCSGCAKAPEAEMAEARAAVKTARDLGAEEFMPKNFRNVIRGMEAAEAEIEMQNKKFFPFRKYDSARDILKKTALLAEDLSADLPEVKKRMASDLENNLPVIRRMVKVTQVSADRATRFVDKDVLGGIKRDLKEAGSIVDSAAEDLKAGNILRASDRLNAVDSTLKKVHAIFLNPNVRKVQFDEAEIR